MRGICVARECWVQHSGIFEAVEVPPVCLLLPFKLIEFLPHLTEIWFPLADLCFRRPKSRPHSNSARCTLATTGWHSEIDLGQKRTRDCHCVPE